MDKENKFNQSNLSKEDLENVTGGATRVVRQNYDENFKCPDCGSTNLRYLGNIGYVCRDCGAEL